MITFKVSLFITKIFNTNGVLLFQMKDTRPTRLVPLIIIIKILVMRIIISTWLGVLGAVLQK